MTTTTLTPAALIDAAKAAAAAEAALMATRPPGMPRAHWRAEHSMPSVSIEVRDTALKSRPRRVLHIAASNVYDVWVWRTGSERPGVVEHINLRAADAAERLGRYTPA